MCSEERFAALTAIKLCIACSVNVISVLLPGVLVASFNCCHAVGDIGDVTLGTWLSGVTISTVLNTSNNIDSTPSDSSRRREYLAKLSVELDKSG